MTQRLDYKAASPDSAKALFAIGAHLMRAVPRPLLDIVWLRVSQINGCAYCVDLHSREAKQHGASDRQLHHVAIWWESPLFDAAERAALRYAEAITRLTDQRVPEEVYAEAAAQFPPALLTDLTMAIATMNAWNRMAITFRQGPPA